MSFFGDSYNEKKLKANLKLAINRLKLVEKKKTEIALRARKEISDYIKVNKIERARIRVEHIIREDYLVEALEIIEMQCDLILARVALLGGKGKGNKVPHVSIHEAIDSILWAYPQIAGDCQELKIVVGQLAILFGKQYVHEVQNKAGDENPHVNAKLVSRLDPSTPKAYIIETYSKF
jgi:vacuolar protein sorting-associated protein IST1